MQPTLCSKCKKNVAVVFISRMNEKNEMVNEGLCLQCAAKLGLPQVEDMMKRMGITPEDLESLSTEMMQAFGGAEEMNDLPEGGEEDDEESGKTATFPFLNRLFGNNNQPAPQSQQPADSGQQPAGRKTEKKRKFLDNYCINLSQRARDGKLDAVIGREQEIERVVQILNRRQKNNPCLIGEPGVGKTAIAEGLAQRIVKGEVPYKLRDKEVYLLDLTALVAGTQFRGQFEQRMKGLIDEVKRLGNIILMIDEIHNIAGAGDAEGSMNAANILKPALSRGEIQVIGATTFTEYRKFIEKDTALERRFQPVTVNEPSIEDSIAILKGIAPYYERYHGVKIPDGMLRQAVLLSERYITDRFLPDKAIDLIDEACSDLNLKDKGISRRMEIQRELEASGLDSIVYVGVETLEYLRRGGRVTAGAAAIGAVLQIKPLLKIEGELLDACVKVRGTAGCKKKLLETIYGDVERLSAKWDIDIAVAGSYQDAAALEDWREMAVNAFPEHGNIFADPLSFSVSSHVGPDAFGMAVSRRLARTKDGI